ncbi:hypothetical protein SHIRM173S_06959 [Streptomyces hirsutus]
MIRTRCRGRRHGEPEKARAVRRAAPAPGCPASGQPAVPGAPAAQVNVLDHTEQR